MYFTRMEKFSIGLAIFLMAYLGYHILLAQSRMG